MSIYIPWVLLVLCFFFVRIYGAWKAKQKSTLYDLPGPRPESFLLGTNRSQPLTRATAENHSSGNLRQMMREQVGCYDLKLQGIYGMVARIKAPFGVRRFLSPLSGVTILTSKPNRMIGCGSPIRKPFNILCKLRATIS